MVVKAKDQTFMEQNSVNHTRWKTLEILLLMTLLLSLVLEFFVFSLGDIPGSVILRIELSGLLFFIGIIILFFAKYSLRKNTVRAVSDNASNALVTGGIFKYSRNPIYLSMMIMLAGAGLIFNNLWIIILIFPLSMAIYRMLILSEEIRLTAQFGNEYIHYMKSVRRWL